jgi:tRNA pseudouridine55 synthase
MGICGILNVDKPAEWTSRAVVDRVERVTRPSRAGHAGTLDPLATGVLVVCVGQATRLIQYVQRLPKCYRASFLLGHLSPTDDIEGEVTLVEGAPEPRQMEIEAALPRFLGLIEQRPPQHSAVKIGGRRAYDLARRGHEFELPPRTVTVHRLAITRYHYHELDLEIECGSGTYVRALGRDLAASLGTAAVMSALERTGIGRFRVTEAVPIDELNDDTLADHLQPPLAAVDVLPRVELTDADLVELGFGRPIAMREGGTVEASGTHAAEYAGVDPRGRLASILYEKLPSQLWPVRNFVPL